MTDDLAEAKRHIEALIITSISAHLCKDAQAFLSRLDAEGQRVEGGDEDERKWLVYYHDKDMRPELFALGGNAEECARKHHANQLGAWSCHLFREVFPGEQVAIDAELTRLKSAQSEHDRTVRNAAYDAAAQIIEDGVEMDSNFDGKHIGKRQEGNIAGLIYAKAIRALKTGQESGT